MKKLFMLLLLLSALLSFSQTNYRYVLLPTQFSCQKVDNQFRLNDAVKSFFISKGYTVYMSDEVLPANIAKDRCLALEADVIENNTMFQTNLTVVVKTCDGNVFATSAEGKSREKDFNVSYNLAFRDAVKNFEIPKVGAREAIVIEMLQDEVEPSSQTLFAQETPNGYQLVDTAPKIIFKLTKTNMPNYFMAVRGTVNGVVYKKDNQWVFDYYDNEVLKTEKLQIKF